VSAACALIAGSIEVAIAAYKRFVLHQLIFLSHDFAWMVPVSFLLILVPVAIVIHSVLVAIRHPPRLATVLGTLTAFLVFILCVPYGRIAWWASSLVGVGIGMQVARRARSVGQDRWLPALRRVSVVLAVLIAGVGVTVRADRAWAERQASAGKSIPLAGAPNVLLLVLDTVRASNMGLYGYERPTTPELQKWASHAVVFDQAIATASWTLPSHSSLFTGRPPGTLGVDWLRPLSAQPPTLAEEFRKRGYATAGFAANLLYTSSESGLARGFTHYDDYRVSPSLVVAHSTLGRIDVKSRLFQAKSMGQAWRALLKSTVKASNITSAGYRPADHVAESFLAWQAALGDSPFFAFLNFFDAHVPYYSPESFRPAFDHKASSASDRYDAAIAWLDHVVGQVLTSLRDRGVLDRTIVIITSDHGEQFGEHGLIEHGNSLYLPVLKVPLLVRFPPLVPSARVGTFVSLRDVAATVLELAGVAGTHGIPGTSLSAAWRQPDLDVLGDVTAELGRGINEGPLARNGQGDVVSRFDGRFQYIRNGDGTEELFDVLADPQQLTDLVSSPGVQVELGRLRSGLPGR